MGSEKVPLSPIEEREASLVVMALNWFIHSRHAGISEEQTKRGDTLSICLSEIDRCRPFFLCLLGSRYGWCQPPDATDKLLLETFVAAETTHSWLQQYRDRSITELEVRYALLDEKRFSKSPSAAMIPFVYLRNNENACGPSTAGPQPFQEEAPEHVNLTQLKQELRYHYKERVLEYSECSQMVEHFCSSFLSAVSKVCLHSQLHAAIVLTGLGHLVLALGLPAVPFTLLFRRCPSALCLPLKKKDGLIMHLQLPGHRCMLVEQDI